MGKKSQKTAQNKPAPPASNSTENPQITKNNPLASPAPSNTIDLTPVDGSGDEFGLPGAADGNQRPSTNAGPPDANGGNSTPFVPCSYFSCANGHMWPPEIQVARCPGCQGPVIGVRFRNCPACNEPGLRWTLRHDRIPVRGNDPLPIAAACRGQEGPAETQMVDFKMVLESDPEKEVLNG